LNTDSSTRHGWFAGKTITHIVPVLHTLLAIWLYDLPKHVAITDPYIDCVSSILLIIDVVLWHLLIIAVINLVVPVLCRWCTFLFFSWIFKNASHVLLKVFHFEFVDHVLTLSYAFQSQLIDMLVLVMCILDILALEVAGALTI